MAAVAPPAQPAQTSVVQLPAAQNPQVPANQANPANTQTTTAANPAAKPAETTKETPKAGQPDAKTETKTALPGTKTETKEAKPSSSASSSSAAKTDVKDKEKDLKTSTDAKGSTSTTMSAKEVATTVLDVAGKPTMQKQAQCEYTLSFGFERKTGVRSEKRKWMGNGVLRAAIRPQTVEKRHVAVRFGLTWVTSGPETVSTLLVVRINGPGLVRCRAREIHKQMVAATSS